MARYIDLEEFAKRINENIKPDTPEEKALIEWCKDECIRQGYAMPRADVVPRNEDRYIPLEDELLTRVFDHYKKTVVRDILDDAIRAVYEKTDMKIYNTIDQKPLGDHVAYGKQMAMYEVITLLAELKKKYT